MTDLLATYHPSPFTIWEAFAVSLALVALAVVALDVFDQLRYQRRLRKGYRRHATTQRMDRETSLGVERLAVRETRAAGGPIAGRIPAADRGAAGAGKALDRESGYGSHTSLTAPPSPPPNQKITQLSHDCIILSPWQGRVATVRRKAVGRG